MYVCTVKEISRYPGCFVCGEKNTHGLQARFYWDGSTAFTEAIALTQFEGYKGILHGGVLSTLLDEVMVKAVLASGYFALTAEITVRFILPIRTGDKIRFRGRIIEHKGRLFVTTAEAENEHGAIVARAEARFLEAKSELRQQLENSLDI